MILRLPIPENPRSTLDIDYIIDTSLENEALVYPALEGLPDHAVKELRPGEVSEYAVVRVADEIVVDLMASACGIRYEEASQDVVTRTIDGVPTSCSTRSKPVHPPSRFADSMIPALTMIAQGVTEFATVNVKDFEGLGFRRVWNPLVKQKSK